jgi:hypothetical protein
MIHEDTLLNKEFDTTMGIIDPFHVLGQATLGNTCVKGNHLLQFIPW